MKLYQSLLLIALIVGLLVSLNGCVVIPLSKYYDIPAEEVVSVQFYDLRNREAGSDSEFDSVHEPVYTVPEEEKVEFLSDFSKVKFSDTIIIAFAAIDPSFSYGEWVIRINFSDGQYTFYSCDGYGQTFDAEGNCISSTHYGCDDAELERLIGKYYEIG